MALLRAFETDEYWADYAVVVVRDRDGGSDYSGSGMLVEFENEGDTWRLQFWRGAARPEPPAGWRGRARPVPRRR